MPFGILEKSPTPSSFCSLKQNGQWSVDTQTRSLVRRPFHRSWWWCACSVRMGGEQTYLAPSKPGWARCSSRRQVEVLRAGLAEHVGAAVAGRGHRLERLAGRHVHDVERDVAGHLRQHDGPVGGLALQLGSTDDAVVLRVGLAPGQRLRDEHVDGDAVLGVHHDHRAVVGRPLHGPQDLAVVAVEDAGVGHEELEAGDALVVHQVVHGLERVVVDAADDLVEAVVDGAVAVGLLVPRAERLDHVAAVASARRSR